MLVGRFDAEVVRFGAEVVRFDAHDARCVAQVVRFDRFGVGQFAAFQCFMLNRRPNNLISCCILLL